MKLKKEEFDQKVFRKMDRMFKINKIIEK